MTTIKYTVPKVKKGTNLPYYGLSNNSFLIPFPYFNTSDVIVSMQTTEDILLTEGTNYEINGSVLVLDEESLNLDIDSGLDIAVNASRNTNLNLATYVAGHPVKASDLNYNFEQLVYKIEENNTLILNNTYVSDTAPAVPYKGQTWLRTPYYVHYIFDGTSWVQPT